MPTLVGGASNLGRRLLPIWGVTSRPSDGGRGESDCQSIASTTASSGRFMPTRRNSMRGGIDGRLGAQPMPTSQTLTIQSDDLAFGRRVAGFLWVELLIVGLLVVAYSHYPKPRCECHRPKIQSLAVLPLKNLSGDPTQEYLADGMTEELIGRFAAIHDLRVISRTSVMGFRDTKLSVPEIAKTLGRRCHC